MNDKNNDIQEQELDWWKYATSPLKEQIEVVNKITQVLGIDFPNCSSHYNKATYSWFIKRFVQEYKLKEKMWLETHDYVTDIEWLGTNYND